MHPFTTTPWATASGDVCRRQAIIVVGTVGQRAVIRGDVFCSFLALVLQKELADLHRSHDASVEWDDLIRDLDRLQEATIKKDGKRVTIRTRVSGQVGRVFQAAGAPLPPNWREHPA